MMRWLGGMVAAWLLALSSVALPSARVLQRRFEPLMFID